MSTELNPFWIDGPVTPARFIGRKREVRKTFSQLIGPGQGSVAINGHRYTGKTSLLRYIAAPEVATAWDLTADNTLIAFHDCRLMDHPFHVTTFWRQMLTLLRPHLPASMGEALQELCQQGSISNADFELILDALHEEGQRLILLLDNFEQLIRTQTTPETVIRDFLSQLRALINRQPRTLSLVVTTEEPLEEVCQTIDFGGASPFPNSFMSVCLKGFSEQEINELIENALSGTGVTFDAHERSHISRLSGGHPLLTQLAGYLLFEAKMAGPVTAESYQAVEARFREEVKRWRLP